MKTLFTIAVLLIFETTSIFGQGQVQYFDGADTIPEYSIQFEIDTSPSNIWQIGSPHKVIFNEASTVPNAIVTDTINTIPVKIKSSFQYTFKPIDFWGILAFQWIQKIDLEHGGDGGKIEFSIDSGNTWVNAWDSPYVYNFYGFDQANFDTLDGGEYVFTGIDSTWKNIWLCFDLSWLSQEDVIMVKYTLISDANDNHNEGWMLDNFRTEVTFFHTISEIEQEEYMMVAPNPTNGRIEIVVKKLKEFHIIEEMSLMNAAGNILKTWYDIPTKFFIDIGEYPNGLYFLDIKTNKDREVHEIILQK